MTNPTDRPFVVPRPDRPAPRMDVDLPALKRHTFFHDKLDPLTPDRIRELETKIKKYYERAVMASVSPHGKRVIQTTFNSQELIIVLAAITSLLGRDPRSIPSTLAPVDLSDPDSLVPEPVRLMASSLMKSMTAHFYGLTRRIDRETERNAAYRQQMDEVTNLLSRSAIEQLRYKYPVPPPLTDDEAFAPPTRRPPTIISYQPESDDLTFLDDMPYPVAPPPSAPFSDLPTTDSPSPSPNDLSLVGTTPASPDETGIVGLHAIDPLSHEDVLSFDDPTSPDPHSDDLHSDDLSIEELRKLF